MVGELLGESPMRPVVLGGDEKAGRVLVEPVHDARPLHAADARQAVAAMVDQRVDQRAGGVARTRMHNKSRRLVDDDQLVVLVEDVEGDGFPSRFRDLRFWQADLDRLARLQLVARIGDRHAAECDRAAPDQRLDAAAGKIPA